MFLVFLNWVYVQGDVVEGIVFGSLSGVGKGVVYCLLQLVECFGVCCIGGCFGGVVG